MMHELPSYVSYTFIACVVVTIGFIRYAVSRAAEKDKSLTSTIVLIIIMVWFSIIAFLTYFNFFLDFDSQPPRLVIGAVLLIIIMITLFSVKQSRLFIGRMPLTTLTYIHLVRIPVEIVLWWLFLHRLVPAEITFEGMNYDILSGLSAPFIALFLLGKKNKSIVLAVIWNIVGIGMLANVVARAILATPYFQVSGDSELLNVAVFYFPFIFLPLIVVPSVLFSHLASLLILIKSKASAV